MNPYVADFIEGAEKHHGPGAMDELADCPVDGGEDALPDMDLADVDEDPAGWALMNPTPRESAAARRSSTAKTEREGSNMNAAQPLKPSTAPPSRMALSAVKRGRVEAPHRILMYGPEGIGKSSFGAGAPAPIFLPLEDGTNHLDVARLPKAESWREAREGVRLLINEKHDYKTLVVDTLDALEALLWRHMCERDKFTDDKAKKPLKDVEDYGFGKGYNKALEDWRAWLKDLETLSLKGLHVVQLVHSQVKNFKNPAGEDYERYELALNAKAAGLLKGWSDTVLFANYETFAKKDDRTKRVKAFDSGARLLFTERRAAYDAKHRGSLPESLPLSWADFEAESKKEIDPAAFAAEILRKAAELAPDVQKLVADTVEKVAGNVQSLININNRVNTRVAEQAAQKEEG